MKIREFGLCILLMSLAVACQRTDPTCAHRVRALRARLGEIDWSMIAVTPEFEYARVPVASGDPVRGPLPYAFVPRSVAIEDSRIELTEEVWPSTQPLPDWLVRRASRMYGVLIKERDPDAPLYLLATANIRVAKVRAIVEALRPIAVVHVAVRPPRQQAVPWPPAQSKLGFLAAAVHARPGEDDLASNRRLIQAGEVPAAGCPAAVALVRHDAMDVYERLLRVPDAFEQCGCRGDMDTLAALYWKQSIDDNMKPIRWFPWDETLARQLGDDATYAELIEAIVTKGSSDAAAR